MFLGYILANKITFKLPKWAVILDWLLNTALCLALIYIIVIPYSKDFDYDNLDAAFFAAFHRLGWSVGIGWVIWACVNGYAGKIKKYFKKIFIYINL
jgi:DNA modification methylase